MNSALAKEVAEETSGATTRSGSRKKGTLYNFTKLLRYLDYEADDVPIRHYNRVTKQSNPSKVCGKGAARRAKQIPA